MKFNRIAYSAAHVVADPLAAVDPWLGARSTGTPPSPTGQRLWSLGLGVAEAMDTAQRGMGPGLADLAGADPPLARCGPDVPGAGRLGLRHRPPGAGGRKRVDDVIRAYEEQMAAIEKLGGGLIVMASRALARVAQWPADYESVYGRILSQASSR